MTHKRRKQPEKSIVIKQAWRDVMEVAAVVSVVGGLMLVAYEIRQANGIARAQAVMDLSAQYNEMNRTRFSDPVYADLDNYRNDLSLFLTDLPGIVPTLVQIYETQIGKQNAYVFEPLAELVEESRTQGKLAE